MVQSLQLQSQQSRGDFIHFVHLKDTANCFISSASNNHNLRSENADKYSRLHKPGWCDLWDNAVTLLQNVKLYSKRNMCIKTLQGENCCPTSYQGVTAL